MPTNRTARLLKKRLLLTGLLAFLTGSAFAQTTPRLDGVPNFRDIGGYKTADGKTIRSRLVYRSGQLSQTTPDDQRKLAQLGIRYEIDLRQQSERTAEPSHWGPNPPKVMIGFHYPSEVPAASAPATSATQIKESYANTYAELSLAHAEDIGSVLRALSRADAPALVHCSGGKDRTGVTFAVLMTLLGVPRSDVYHEYLRSNEGLDELVDRRIAFLKAHNQPVPLPRDLMKINAGVEATWLDDSFHAIEAKYHSFDAYVHDGLKLTDADIQRLHARLLEK